MPNAGKSSLLKAMTGAKAKVCFFIETKCKGSWNY